MIMMSRTPFFLSLALMVTAFVLASAPASAQSLGAKGKVPPLTNATIEKARDKAIRAYDFQTEFPGASDAERQVSRAQPMKIPDEPKIEEQKPSKWWAKVAAILGPIMRVLGWVLLTAIVLGLIYYAATWSGGLGWKRKEEAAGADQMAPVAFDGRSVKDWLREAEALAEQGRYAEAVHFLLFSSFDDIRKSLNTALRPAWTSREILRDVPLRSSAQTALSMLVETVESSEFAGRDIGSVDFYRCRDTYAKFVTEVAA
jgi:hypothetical protein